MTAAERWFAGAWPACTAAVVVPGKCGDSAGQPEVPGPPAELEIVLGGGQTGVIGTALPLPVRVKLTDASGTPVNGPAVRSVSRVARVALLLAAAALPGCKDSTGSKAGPGVALAIVGGNAQTGTVGAELGQPLAVKVTDAQGRPVKGETVRFIVNEGGGHILLGTTITNDEGVAQDRWTLGLVAGAAQSVAAQFLASYTGQVLAQGTFTATAAAGAPATLAPVDDTIVDGVVGTLVEDTFGVRVRDQYGNPVPGAQVVWSVLEGGGTIVTPAPTDANGISHAQWVLGPDANLRQRAAATLAGQTVRYTAGVATALVKVAGDGGTDGAGTSIGVMVTASTPTFITRLPVHWQVTGGGGSVRPVNLTVSTRYPATASWTLGPGGPQTLTASAGNLSVTFTATAIPRLATVPGLVLDATTDRVAWIDNAGNISVRTLATGADQFVRNDPDYRPGAQQFSFGQLFSTGVVLWNDTQNELFDWHPGSLAFIGYHYGPYSTDGDWLAKYTAYYDYGLLLRHLTDRNTITVPGTKTAEPSSVSSLDVAPDGGVAYVLDKTLLVYRNGTTTPRYTVPQGVSVRDLVLDDDNVVVQQVGVYGTVEVVLVSPSGVESLGSAVLANTMAAGGWTAWWVYNGSDGFTGVWRRSPAGTRVRLNDPVVGAAHLEALSPNGSVVLWADHGETFFIVDAAGNYRVACGYAEGDRIVWRDGHFVLIRSVYGTGSVLYDLGS